MHQFARIDFANPLTFEPRASEPIERASDASLRALHLDANAGKYRKEFGPALCKTGAWRGHREPSTSPHISEEQFRAEAAA